MEKAEIASLKQELKHKRHDLLRQLGRSQLDEDEVDQGTEDPQDSEDQAADLSSRQSELGVTETLEELLLEVDAALVRMEEGTYGLCQVCGKPIPFKRLEIVPWARADVEHADQVEREKRL